jgi:adenine-specific DNA-methyltransferase
VVELFCGDCLDVLPTLPDNSVDLVLTDPPYFKVKGDAWDRQWDKPAQFLVWLDAVVEQLARVMKPNGSLYLFASPQMAARVECQIAVRLNVLNSLVWRKERGRWNGAGKESLRGYFPQTERIIFAEHYGADNIAKGEAGYAAKCDELRGFVFEPLRAYLDGDRERAGVSVRQVAEAFQRKSGSRTVTGMAGHWFGAVQWVLPTRANYEWLRELLNASGGEYLRREYEDLRREYEDLRREYEDLRREYEDLRRPFSVTADVPYTDVWDFPTVQAYPGKHPCEKPQPLLRHIIEASSKPGAVVLDAFMGTGSTGIACKALGREFIGIEMSPDYHAQAGRRIAATEAQADLFAA